MLNASLKFKTSGKTIYTKLENNGINIFHINPILSIEKKTKYLDFKLTQFH